jgi:hypothetical protein
VRYIPVALVVHNLVALKILVEPYRQWERHVQVELHEQVVPELHSLASLVGNVPGVEGSSRQMAAIVAQDMTKEFAPICPDAGCLAQVLVAKARSDGTGQRPTLIPEAVVAQKTAFAGHPVMA